MMSRMLMAAALLLACGTADAASRRYVWGRNGGMRGWKSTKSSVHSYRNQQINGGIHGLAPYPWNRRDQKHGKIVVKSPSFCYPSKIVFKMQGGKSPTKNSGAGNYLGLVLVDVATGKVMNQQEQHANTHTFKTITWNLKTSRKAKYRLELRDGKSNTGWAHLELQDVRITHTPCNVMQNLGGSGCTAKKKCSECRGDCDSDKDCQTGLKCHQRNNKMKVPGCKSGGKGDANTYDFCYRPQNELLNKGGSGCTAKKKCGLCEGDCDRDTDCKKGLRCHQRNGKTQVMGCHKGRGTAHDVSNYDYCYDPTLLLNKGGSGCTAKKKCASCEGDCDRDSDCQKGLKCHQRNGKLGVPGCRKGGNGDANNYDFCYKPTSLNAKGVTGCTDKKKCGACEGDCDADADCKTGLKCFQRNGKVHIHGCDKGGAGDVNNWDYCVNPSLLVNKGGSGCTKKKPCTECQGDCDRDSDCKGAMKCHQRNKKTKVPTCKSGGKGDVNNYDFCYSPQGLQHKGWSGCTPKKKCAACHGDCDSDKDCKTGLKCFQRNGFTAIHGCDKGGSHDTKDYDFCINPLQLHNKGGTGCTAKKKCSECQGDCDRDGDCKTGLKCFQRNSKAGVHACKSGGSGDVSNYDFCYDPAALHWKGGSGCTSKNKCFKCQGDCDRDSDCRTGLKCFQRNNKLAVTGCNAGGKGDVNGHDFCYDPKDLRNKGGSGCTSSKKCAECQGDCDADKDCKTGLKCHQRNDKTEIHGCNKGSKHDVNGYDYCYNPKTMHQVGVNGCTAKKKCGECQGDCDRDADCKTGLKCQQRNGKVQMHGCNKGGSDDVNNWDYCVDPYTMANKGWSGCTSKKKCKACQGDCDRDSDCNAGLKCHQRNNKAVVHGCNSGGTHDVKNLDFCYDPQTLNNKGGSGCTAKKKCGKCQGDCDRDGDCQKGLKCHQRNDKANVHGCNSGGKGDVKGYDFCYDPTQKHQKGVSGCTAKKKCAACQGDCDRDSDCKSGLKCHQRNNKTPTQGCKSGGAGDVNTWDYCYNPKTPCEKGQYGTKSKAGAWNCRSCPAGRYTDKTAQTKCKVCAKGRYSDRPGRGACVKCAKGRYNYQTGRNRVAYCRTCAYGKYFGGTGGTAANQCRACAKGKYASRRGSGGCATCGRGRYAHKTAVRVCFGCAKGRYTAQTGRSAAGHCRACPKGKYTHRAATTSSKACSADWNPALAAHWDRGKCGMGANGKTKVDDLNWAWCKKQQGRTANGKNCALTVNVNKKLCKGGKAYLKEFRLNYNEPTASLNFNERNCFHFYWAQYTCAKQCGRGTYKSGNSCRKCAKGRYNALAGRTSSGQCRKCPKGKYQQTTGQAGCRNCARGSYGPSTGRTAANQCRSCAKGRYGNQAGRTKATDCRICNGGRYSDQTRRTGCKACPSGTRTANTNNQAHKDHKNDCVKGGVLQQVGVNGCTAKNKCARCQGDCDRDADCKTGLKCYQRNNKAEVQSCAKGGKGDVNNWDYCYQPKVLMNKGVTGCTAKAKCGKCQGDCDRDSDCASGLKCWQRNNKVWVQGCNRGGKGDVSGHDFCYSPQDMHHVGVNGCTAKKKCKNCQGDCDRDTDCAAGLKCYQRNNRAKVQGCNRGGAGDVNNWDFCYNPRTMWQKGVSGCRANAKCGTCQGDCDRDSDCKTGLKCFQRNNKTPIHACDSGGNQDVNTWDYCYDPNTLHSKGGSGCTSKSKCGVCQGDCDRNSDCKSGLICHQRNGKSWIHTCKKGGKGDVNSYDYCVNPKTLHNKGGSGCTAKAKCSKCQGDCDRDSDCKSGLKCHQRNAKTPVPACNAGGVGDVNNYDFCVPKNAACSKGLYKSGKDCRACGRGKYSDNNAGCKNCAKGRYGVQLGRTARSQCRACARGKYADQTARTGCKSCARGRYGNQLARTAGNQCRKCGKGKYTKMWGATSCSADWNPALRAHWDAGTCGVGKDDQNWGWCGKTQKKCKQSVSVSKKVCKSGKAYLKEFRLNYYEGKCRHMYWAQYTCSLQCGKGLYRSGNSCRKCQKGRYGNTPGRTRCANCQRGRYADQTGRQGCKACGRGKYNQQTQRQNKNNCRNCPRGRYSAQTARGNVNNCRRCARGRYGSQLGAQRAAQCRACQAGKYQNNLARPSCVNCPSGKSTLATNRNADHDNANDCKTVTPQSCTDGDVRIAPGNILGAGRNMYPEVRYNERWYPICGHYFWDNNHGATTFCKALGFNSGTRGKTRVAFNQNAMPVGKCGAGQKLDKCKNGGHAWGNLNYRNGWCKKGKKIGVSVKCSGGKGKTSSCVDFKWKLLIRQTMPKMLQPVSKWRRFNANKPKDPNYSILNTLGNAHKIGGKFTFKIVWPRRKGKNSNIWRQSSNPVTTRTGAVGYTAMTVNFKQNRFGGLENGYKHGGNNPAALLDGTVNHGNWFYAIGSRAKWNNGIPGAASPESRVELYVGLKACKRGTFKRGNSCRSCAKGKYRGGVHVQAACLNCKKGRYADQTGRWWCKPCAKGRYGNQLGRTAKNQCRKCPKGKWTRTTGAGGCDADWNPQLTAHWDAGSCGVGKDDQNWAWCGKTKKKCAYSVKTKVCKSGTAYLRDFRTEFYEGKCRHMYIAQYTCRKTCRPGTFRKGSTAKYTCTKCPKGKFQSKHGRVGCTNCQTGRYADQTGRPACKVCRKGRYTSQRGRTHATHATRGCRACARGRYSDQAGRKHATNQANGCKTCKIGRYSDQTSRTQCKACPTGSRTPANNNAASHDNKNDCKKPTLKSCQDGDVRVHADTKGGKLMPEVNYKGAWYHVCGHYFWDNQNGATKFCRMLGYHSGKHSGRNARKPLKSDSMPVGKCLAGQRFNKCNQGGHSWGNFGYRGNSCRKGKAVSVTITCSGGKGVKQSCVDTTWKLLFRQTTPKYLSPVSKWKNLNANNKNAPNYSILNTLGNAHKIAGKFTFKIVWPRRKGKNYNVWRQSSNPVQARQRSLGYEAIDVNFKQNRFGGLENGYRHGGNNPRALLDGTVNHGNWFYAIGSRSAWKGGLPGAASAESRVELYVAVPGGGGGSGGKICTGDFNGDNTVDAKDLLNLLGRFAAEKSHSFQVGGGTGTKNGWDHHKNKLPSYNKHSGGKRGVCKGDLTNDNDLDVLDLLKLLQLFGKRTSGKCGCCPGSC